MKKNYIPILEFSHYIELSTININEPETDETIKNKKILIDFKNSTFYYYEDDIFLYKSKYKISLGLIVLCNNQRFFFIKSNDYIAEINCEKYYINKNCNIQYNNFKKFDLIIQQYITPFNISNA